MSADMNQPGQLKILFVCGRNNRRSPTAERIFQNDSRMSVRSAGIADTSKRRLTREDLVWADLILVMERKYVGRIKIAFHDMDILAPIETLDIGDHYRFMQRELIEELKPAVDSALEQYWLEREGESIP